MQPPVLFPVQRTTAPVIYLGQFHQFQIHQIKAEIKAETYLIVFLTCLPIVSQTEVGVHPHCRNVFLKLTKVPMTHKNSGINFLSNSWLSSRISKIKVSSIKTAMHTLSRINTRVLNENILPINPVCQYMWPLIKSL